MVSGTCEQCGEEFSDPDKSEKRFCSRECYLDSVRSAEIVECANCGNSFERSKWHLDQNKERHFCDLECMGEFQSTQTGPDSPAWSGGYDDPTRGETRDPNWREKRRNVLERDGYECLACGMSNRTNKAIIGVGLDAHHNDRTETSDMLATCRFCHPAFD